MPFKSEKQRKWMHINKPEMAKKWEKKEQKKMKREMRVKNLIKKLVREIRSEEKLSEVKKETAIDVARRVVKTKQYDKANGMDLTTANFIVQVYDSQKNNPKVQKKLEKMTVVQLSRVIGKLLR